jgi:hypothetical protein
MLRPASPFFALSVWRLRVFTIGESKEGREIVRTDACDRAANLLLQRSDDIAVLQAVKALSARRE